MQQRYNAGFPRTRDLLPEDLQINSDAVRQEWLYLEIFTFDFATFNALGQTPTRDNLLTPFLGHVRTWLHSMPVPKLPERVAMAIVGSEPLRTIPAEPCESAFTRLSRRMQEYAATLTAGHPQGVNYSVAAVFSARCGVGQLPSITAVAVYFSSTVSQLTELLNSMRIVP